MTKRHLITSALPYINGVKHLGNLVGSMLPADTYARYLRARGESVLFLCATDEHGTPAELAAIEAGMDVADYCQQQHKVQASLAAAFNLSFDYFGRTSSPQNHELTKHFARRLEENGLIEERATRQVYSRTDRRFLPDRYVTGTCPYCGYTRARGDQCESCTRVLESTDLIEPRSSISGSTDLEVRESRHLFLLLPKVADRLRAWIEQQHDWPAVTTSIAMKWLDEGLEDRGITRDLAWGVPVDRPGFEHKVFYVWFDAPIEYVGVTREWADAAPGDRDWKSWWWNAPDVYYTQFMAKDNVPFHTIVFPATLIGSGEPWKLPDYIKGFNWLTYYGGKFSTSQRRGVFMSDALELLPADYWRYYLLANAPESDDSDFTWDLFAAAINKDLVGVFGNFVNRTLKLAASRFDGNIPAGDEHGALERRLCEELSTSIRALGRMFEDRAFRKALQELRAIWVAGNAYLAAAEPWKKVQHDPAAASVAMRVSINLVRLFAIVSEPVMPETSRTILDALEIPADRRAWPAGSIEAELSVLEADRPVRDLPPLFRRIAPEDTTAWTARFAGTASLDELTPR